MEALKHWLVHRLYRPYLKRFRLFESGSYLLKYMLLPFLRGMGPQSYRPPAWRAAPADREKVLRIASVSDEMTRKNLLALEGVEIIELLPHTWRDQLEAARPQVFFCESAWHGTDGCWDYRIHRNKRLLFEHRTALKRILRYCREANIPTVFWNKEDPTFFDDPVNSFSDTALLFDHVFTTCAECVPRYRTLGKEAGVMMFGFSPALYHPVPLEDGENRAFFFGGWYADQPRRCENMRRVFAFVRELGLELTIYDRYGGQPAEENNRFPEEFRPYLHPPVAYEEIRQELAHAAYVVNVTTETDSETMFSRRVFEAMACGRMVISNDSAGLRKLFPGRIWFPGEKMDPKAQEKILAQNLQDVFRNYTFRAQLSRAFRSVGLTITEEAKGEQEI